VILYKAISKGLLLPTQLTHNSLLERTQSKPYCWLPNFTIPIIVSARSFQPDAMAHDHPNPKDYFSIYFDTKGSHALGPIYLGIKTQSPSLPSVPSCLSLMLALPLGVDAANGCIRF